MNIKKLVNIKWDLLFIFGVPGLLIIIGLFYAWGKFVSSKTKEGIGVLGQFGDSFAVLNTFFSGIAMLGVFIAVMYQRKELEDQKKQYEEQKKQYQEELKEQAKQFKEQEKQQYKQQFETRFFNMLNLFNEIIKGLHVKNTTGRDAFINLEVSLKDSRVEEKTEKSGAETLEDYNINKIQKAYSFFFNSCKAGNQLSHYFRSLYTILKFVEHSELEYKIKRQYTSILRAQLSNSELFLLFYNCLWQDKFAPFRLLVEKYAFLEHIQKKEVGAHQLAYYQSNAYGENCPDDMTPGKFNRSNYSGIYPEDKNFIVDEPLTY